MLSSCQVLQSIVQAAFYIILIGIYNIAQIAHMLIWFVCLTDSVWTVRIGAHRQERNVQGRNCLMEIRRYVMKFCQIDKIPTRTCIFEDAEICKFDKISIVTTNRRDYMKYLWG